MKNIACWHAQICCGSFKHVHFVTDTLMRLIKVIKATRINRNNRRIICDSGTPVTKEWKRVSGFLSRKFKNTSWIPVYTLLKKFGTQRQIIFIASTGSYFHLDRRRNSPVAGFYWEPYQVLVAGCDLWFTMQLAVRLDLKFFSFPLPTEGHHGHCIWDISAQGAWLDRWL